MKLFSLVILFSVSFFISLVFVDFNFFGEGFLCYLMGVEKVFKFGFVW